MLQTLIAYSATVSYWLLMKKATVAAFAFYYTLVYGARLPRDWKLQIALVSTADQGSFAGVHIDDYVDGVSEETTPDRGSSC
jgi:hypothetical protein